MMSTERKYGVRYGKRRRKEGGKGEKEKGHEEKH
jgi:hypothetical protein